MMDFRLSVFMVLLVVLVAFVVFPSEMKSRGIGLFLLGILAALALRLAMTGGW